MRSSLPCLLALVAAVSGNRSTAQEYFFRSYVTGLSSLGSSLTPGANGEMHVTGITSTNDGTDQLLMTVGPSGDPLVSRTLDTELDEFPRRVITIAPGRLLLMGSAGHNADPYEKDMVLIKTGTTGNNGQMQAWGTPDSAEVFADVVQTGADLVLLGSSEYERDADRPAFFLMRCDTAYNVAWSTSVNFSTDLHLGMATALAADGSIYALGCLDPDSDGQPVEGVLALMKFTANGTLQWTRKYDVPGNMLITRIDMRVVNDGSVYFMQNYNVNGSGIALFHVAENGDLLWCKHLQAPPPQSLQFTRILLHDDVLYLAGSYGFGSASRDPVLLQCTTAGAVNWARMYGSDETTGDLLDLCISDAPGASPALWAVGVLRPTSSDPQQMFVMKLDLDGHGLPNCERQELVITATDEVPVITTLTPEVIPYNSPRTHMLSMATAEMDMFTACITTGITEAEPAQTGIYPNPTTALCTLTFPDRAPRHVAVFDATGRELHVVVTPGTGRVQVDLGGHEHGVYFVRATDAAGRSAVHRVVMQ